MKFPANINVEWLKAVAAILVPVLGCAFWLGSEITGIGKSLDDLHAGQDNLRSTNARLYGRIDDLSNKVDTLRQHQIVVETFLQDADGRAKEKLTFTPLSNK